MWMYSMRMAKASPLKWKHEVNASFYISQTSCNSYASFMLSKLPACSVSRQNYTRWCMNKLLNMDWEWKCWNAEHLRKGLGSDARELGTEARGVFEPGMGNRKTSKVTFLYCNNIIQKFKNEKSWSKMISWNINKRILALKADVSASSWHHSQGKVSKCCEDLIFILYEIT